MSTLEIAQQLRHLPVAARRHIVKLIERLHEPRADVAPVVETIGDAENLEPAAVVQLEQLRDLPAGRMALERRGKICDPHLVRGVPRRSGRRARDIAGIR